jgi:F-type H+-transporting ATPase subunit epsilon
MKLDIVTMPRPIILNADVYQVVARSFEGELGILPGHMALMALLLPCVVQVYSQSDSAQSTQRVYISGGVLEVQPQHVSVLAEEALFAEEIDIDAARTLLADAQQRMRENFLLEDRERARLEVMSAQAQIDLWQWAQASR